MTDPDGEGSITMDITEAGRLFPTAEIAPDGESGNGQAFDAWLGEGADVAFYRALDGRLLARQARRAHPPSTKLFSDRYDSAQLIGVFLNPNPLPEAEEPEDPSEDPDDLVDDDEPELGDDDEDADQDNMGDLVDAFAVRWSAEECPWPAVQTLNARRARQFLLAAIKSSGSERGGSGFYNALLMRDHRLAFYARTVYRPRASLGFYPGPEMPQREVMCRHYGGPTPRLLPAVPPEILEDLCDEPWQLVATYQDREYVHSTMFGWNWKEQVSTLPLESLLTVHVSGNGEYGMHIENEILKLVRVGEDGTESVTDLGRLGSGDDPLALALRAVPDLLTFDPHTAIDITTDTPYKLADAIRLSTDPDRDEMIDFMNRDGSDFLEGYEEGIVSYFDNLVPLRLRINGLIHFAARLDDGWALIPVHHPYSLPAPVLNRTFLSIEYHFDAGGYSSGGGLETIGEIRPGLNVRWEDFQDEMWNRSLTLSRGDLATFAAEQLGEIRFGHHILDSLLGTEDDLSETELTEGDGEDDTYEEEIVVAACYDERYYDFHAPEIGFEPRNEEGLRFLNALLRQYSEGSDTAARIRAVLGY
ncbi:hypothetical protein [Sphaerimonospora thailandensis]|uniref:Uncharacterized protein n=1 Tax=Sphaerimonospora thailandensis TaxID=795644 RepID=A0A8J3RCX2_9ACTN|nr:hypothetical protein [Sphaerimonospora thailandensis]GIH72006.1 hypothetical protein Mth01_42590 [Sphaerimonospora thailandensis]